MNVQAIRDVIADLRLRTVERLPQDWQKGRNCPDCGAEATRPKCFYEYGGACPRHDPGNYEPSPYIRVPDPWAQALANRLQAALDT